MYVSEYSHTLKAAWNRGKSAKTVLETGLVGGWGLLLFLNSARRAGLLRRAQRRVPELAQGEIEWVVHGFSFQRSRQKLPISALFKTLMGKPCFQGLPLVPIETLHCPQEADFGAFLA